MAETVNELLLVVYNVKLVNKEFCKSTVFLGDLLMDVILWFGTLFDYG